MRVTDARTGRVLVADGDTMNRRILSSTLAADRLAVAVAKDTRTALALISDEPFDVVLLDLLLPPSGGLHVLEQLRQHPDTAVIMVSALQHVDRLATCLELGADDYLHNPINPVLLRTRVRSCLAHQRLRALEAAERRLPDREA